MATLHELLATVPPDTRFRSHLDSRIRTAAELLAGRDETGLAMNTASTNYGRTTYRVIYVPGVGPLYSEVFNA